MWVVGSRTHINRKGCQLNTVICIHMYIYGDLLSFCGSPKKISLLCQIYNTYIHNIHTYIHIKVLLKALNLKLLVVVYITFV